MTREEIREDADLDFIGKTDAQILRELYGFPIRTGRRGFVLPDEQFAQDNMAARPDDERPKNAPLAKGTELGRVAARPPLPLLP